MFSFFKKKQAPVEENKPFVVKAFLSGKVGPIEEVKDEVFSSKALGDGLAIEPEEKMEAQFEEMEEIEEISEEEFEEMEELSEEDFEEFEDEDEE